MKSLILKNTSWSAAETAANIIVGLILARVMVRVMGLDLYGLFLTLSLFSSYGVLNMLDFGMGSAVTSFVARYHYAQPERLPSLWTFASAYFVFIAAAGTVIASVLLVFYQQSATAKLAAYGLPVSVLVPTVLLVTLTFISGLVESFLRGLNDFGGMQRVSIALHFARLAGICIIASRYHKFDWIMYWLVFCMTSRLLLLLRYLYSTYPAFMRFAQFSKRDLREWLQYSLTLFVSSITGFFFNVTDKFLIMAFLPVASMGEFEIASKPQGLIRTCLSVLLSAVLPASALYYSLNKKEQLREMFFRGSQWICMILVPPLIVLTIFASGLIGVWVGREYSGLGGLAQLFICYLYFNFAASLANTMLVGMGLANRLIAPQIISTIINFGMSIVLVRSYGLYGLVWGTVAGYLVVSLWNIAVIRVSLGLTWSVFLRRLLLPVVTTISVPLGLALVCRSITRDLTVLGLGAVALGVVVFSYAVYGFIIVERDERRQVLAATKSVCRRALVSMT